MMDYQFALGLVTVVLALLGYGLYFRSIFRGETKPHPFTWLIFAIIDGTVFLALIWNDAGPGAWGLGVAVVMNTYIFFLSLRRGEKRIVMLDWVCLLLALLGILMWKITDDALFAVICACAADALAKVPTIRKSYLRPLEESLSVWSLDLLKYSLAIAALSSITLTTALFHAEIVLSNAVVVLIILWRRRQLAGASSIV